MPAHKPSIALFANRDSEQRDALRDILLEQGSAPLCLDIQLTGLTAPTLNLGFDRTCWDGHDFADIRAVHIRCTSPNTLPLIPALQNQASHSELRSRYWREQECMSSTYAFFDALEQRGKLVVNPLTSAYLDHNAKAQLYHKLRANGFPAPRTLTTNDGEQARQFIQQVGEAVAKPAIGVGSTRLITATDQQRFDEFAYCPVMLQERIHGDTIRVHIVGDSVVLALRILSAGNIDSRTQTQGFVFKKLPQRTEQLIVEANRLLGLHYSAWDIIGKGDGEYHFLDCNPGPFIMWIGPDNVRIVFTDLAKYLINYANTGSVQEASAAVLSYTP